MICGRADAHRPLNAGPRRWQRGGGFGGLVSSPASCVERISIKWSKTDELRFLYFVHSSPGMIVPQPERPLGRHVVPARRRERVER